MLIYFDGFGAYVRDAVTHEPSGLIVLAARWLLAYSRTVSSFSSVLFRTQLGRVR